MNGDLVAQHRPRRRLRARSAACSPPPRWRSSPCARARSTPSRQRGRRGKDRRSSPATRTRFLSAVQIGVTVAGFASAAYGASSIAPSVVPLLEALGPRARALAVDHRDPHADAHHRLSLARARRARAQAARDPAQRAVRVRRRARARTVSRTLMRPVIWLLSVSTNAVVRLLGRRPATSRATSSRMKSCATSCRATRACPTTSAASSTTCSRSATARSARSCGRGPRSWRSTAPTRSPRRVDRVQALPYSRYPVVDQSIDDIIGFVHVRDLYDAAADRRSRPSAT